MELDLLERCRAGDREAFRALVAHWGDPVLRLATALTRDRGRAAEAARAALLACWRELPSLHSERPFRPWLLGKVAREAMARAPQNGDRCIDRVEGDARIAAVLETFAGLGRTELAAALGSNLGTTTKLVRRARKALDGCVDGKAGA